MVVRISMQLVQPNTEQLAAVCTEALCIGVYETIENTILRHSFLLYHKRSKNYTPGIPKNS
jgi:hypothetical protein